MVYVLNQQGQPIMPSIRHGWVRRALKDGKAKVVNRTPFVIQLTYEPGTNVLQVTHLGGDSGYKHVGVSVVCQESGRELFAAQVDLLEGMSERLRDRAMYRRARRSRGGYRKPRFYKNTKPEDWLPPSTQHKVDSHIRLIEKVKTFLPVTQVTVEVGSFDPHALKLDGEVQGTGYQQGEQKGFDNLRQYILFRDNHQCQCPSCKGKSDILEVHHIGYWKQDRSDRPGNLITLCSDCHSSANHQKGGVLFGWQPKVKALKQAIFMPILAKRLKEALPDVQLTYGFETKAKRKAVGIDKSHVNDAFVIAGGRTGQRCAIHSVEQKRRNNRSLRKFYDAKYVDKRDGSVKTGKELSSSRKTRSRESLGENLRQYRAHKLKAGRWSTRIKRAEFQPGDLIRYKGQVITVKGSKSYGRYVVGGGYDSIPTKGLQRISYGKGFIFNLTQGGAIPPTTSASGKLGYPGVR